MSAFRNGKGKGQPGFYTNTWGPDGGSYGNFRMNSGRVVEYELKVEENEILAALAQKGSGAQYKVWWRLKGDEDYHAFKGYTLFTNTLGTGYMRMGLPCYLELYRGNALDNALSGDAYTATDTLVQGYGYVDNDISQTSSTNKYIGSGLDLLGKYCNTLNYRYTAQRGDYFGNKAVPYGGGIETANSYGKSLLTKINEATFYDAAGNPLRTVTSSAGVNIFDKNDGGYDVIVDAEPPTYTRTGNGITPDILTNIVANKNDTFDFIVTFSEATITKRGWDNSKTYLLLNNGDRAYFKSKNNKQWVFEYKPLTGVTEEETTQLLVIALCNDALDGSLKSGAEAIGSLEARANIAKVSFNADGRTITDYVGNIMADRANETALTNSQQVESSTDWAQIAIDNTMPRIDFSYNPYNATLKQPTEGEAAGSAGEWGRAGNVYVSATDPDIKTPDYEPNQSEAVRPGSGIFRPDNATAAAESASSPNGLIYYVWSDSETPPDAGENFAVIKRYALAGWDQTAIDEMNTEGSPYASWKSLYDRGLRLSMANNNSDIVPPKEFLTSENSGVWYLHVWTADMTWDSARQLMQYEMMYSLKYNAGYDPASALTEKLSMIEANFSANNQSASSKYTYDQAWNAVKAAYFQKVYTADYLALLNNSGKDIYSDDAELYARNETIKGRDNVTFAPDDCITRQEAMVMMERAAKLLELEGAYGTLDRFSDAEQVSDWALPAAQFNVGTGLIQGDDTLRIHPTDSITRAESATVILRLLRTAGWVDVR